MSSPMPDATCLGLSGWSLPLQPDKDCYGEAKIINPPLVLLAQEIGMDRWNTFYILMSDGVDVQKALLCARMDNLIHRGKLQEGSVFQLIKLKWIFVTIPLIMEMKILGEKASVAEMKSQGTLLYSTLHGESSKSSNSSSFYATDLEKQFAYESDEFAERFHNIALAAGKQHERFNQHQLIYDGRQMLQADIPESSKPSLVPKGIHLHGYPSKPEAISHLKSSIDHLASQQDKLFCYTESKISELKQQIEPLSAQFNKFKLEFDSGQICSESKMTQLIQEMEEDIEPKFSELRQQIELLASQLEEFKLDSARINEKNSYEKTRLECRMIELMVSLKGQIKLLDKISAMAYAGYASSEE